MIRTGITHIHALQETRLSLVALITSSPVVPAPLMISLVMECERKNSNVDGIAFNSRLTIDLTTKILRIKERRTSVIAFYRFYCLSYTNYIPLIYFILLYNKFKL